MYEKAFTLTEIVVAAAVVGMLTTVAIPGVGGFINRSYAYDAMNNLMAIYAAEQNYAQSRD